MLVPKLKKKYSIISFLVFLHVLLREGSAIKQAFLP